MGDYVLGFDVIGRDHVDIVGGKGAHLGELSRIEGVLVPPGFCVTTDAFRRIVTDVPSIGERLEQLAHVGPDDDGSTRDLSTELRHAVESVPIPGELATAIADGVALLGEDGAYAVRSSATREDLPGVSAAGQHDSFLDVVGPAAVLAYVSRCWASLFTERAVAYRLRNGVDHRLVQMAVVVQRMVRPDASGVAFTADPVTSDRRVVCVEAVAGLGEALVTGRVTPDTYRVRDGRLTSASVATDTSDDASPADGSGEVAVTPQRRDRPALTDPQVLALADLARRVEAHLGCPQDIEWCLADGAVHLVQSRPITTLFPVPATDDGMPHVFVSVGHNQMMTDAMTPLGISVWLLTTPRPMFVAGGRLFVDVVRQLGSPGSRAGLLDVMGRGDPLVRDALETVLERDDWIPPLPDVEPTGAPAGGAPAGTSAGDAPAPLETDPAIVTRLMADTRASIAALRRDIAGRSGPALIEFILADLPELRRLLFDPLGHQVFMSAMEATWWLNDHLEAWLGEKNAADTLARSVPDNVTSEMGLALMDVADVLRPHPEVVAFLEHVGGDEDFLDHLAGLEGGPQARAAIGDFLDEYGMRCVGEIDISRPRWSERPTTLVPVLLGNVRNFGPGAGRRRFEEGRDEARRKEEDVVARVRALPDGEQRAEATQRMIDRVRSFIGYREYPKYGMVSRYFVYKRALLAEAGRLVAAHVLREPEDIFFLTFDELGDVVRTHRADERLIDRRREEFASYRTLTPPRVMTSDGEVITGTYRRDGVPPGALVGLPVSTGIAEGRARVVADLAGADLETGDILVTAYTDPSWTPAFVALAGLVTEVGGQMTHGAVIAREYGLPAVVGVQGAMGLVRDGQRIRIDGTLGTVELLS
jgi:rifampicin phosphotransferase